MWDVGCGRCGKAMMAAGKGSLGQAAVRRQGAVMSRIRCITNEDVLSHEA